MQVITSTGIANNIKVKNITPYVIDIGAFLCLKHSLDLGITGFTLIFITFGGNYQIFKV
jgi:hypothetical protein